MLKVELTMDAGGSAEYAVGMRGLINDVYADYGGNGSMNYYILQRIPGGGFDVPYLSVTGSNTDGLATMTKAIYVDGHVTFRATGGTAGETLTLYCAYLPFRAEGVW
jgi:hypothetical protein